MSSEQSLLEQISEKEQELKRENDLICKESEDIVLNARKQASRILEIAEQEGKMDADIVYEQHMQALTQDIISIREEGNREAEKVRSQGEKNLFRAVSKIISAVTG
ncbi:MAG: V-type ATPase subunit subunit G family protein [Methanobacteriota archaeon]